MSLVITVADGYLLMDCFDTHYVTEVRFTIHYNRKTTHIHIIFTLSLMKSNKRNGTSKTIKTADVTCAR